MAEPQRTEPAPLSVMTYAEADPFERHGDIITPGAPQARTHIAGEPVSSAQLGPVIDEAWQAHVAYWSQHPECGHAFGADCPSDGGAVERPEPEGGRP